MSPSRGRHSRASDGLKGRPSDFDQPRTLLGRASSFFTNKKDTDDQQFMMADDPTMRVRWNVVDLRTLSLITCFCAILLTGAIPLAEQFIWYQYDARLTEICIANWVVAGTAGIVGMTAVLLRRSYLVAFHVILGGMLGAGIGLYSVIMYYDMTVRCEVMQAAYVGCSGCECALQNKCSKDDLMTEACSSCAAWPNEVCEAVTAFSLTSIMGLLAVIFTSVPVGVNLLLLLRMEAQTGEAFKTMRNMDTSELEHQMELLAVGADPTARPTSINLLIDRVKDHGDTRLADKASAALNVYRAVKRGPPETNKIKELVNRTKGPALLNVAALAQKQASMRDVEGDLETGASSSQTPPVLPPPKPKPAGTGGGSSAAKFKGLLKGGARKNSQKQSLGKEPASVEEPQESSQVEVLSEEREEYKIVPVGVAKLKKDDWSMSRFDDADLVGPSANAISTFELEN